MASPVHELPYVDIQHDALAVFDDVDQGIIVQEDVWVSAVRQGRRPEEYQIGSPSVHGKIRVEARDGGGTELTCRDGVEVDRISKSNFTVDAPALKIQSRFVRFPRQIIQPPYTKPSSVSPELNINALAYSSKAGKLVIGGPDGYCIVLDPAKPSEPLELKGHVGDVLHVQWFPSGEVVLTASSDLSLRIFSAQTGVNPRTLRGHTRAVTHTAILGVGREVLSSSKDGSVRLWNVGEGKELRKWLVGGGKFVDAMVVVDDAAGLRALGAEGEAEERLVVAASPDGTLSVFSLSSDSSAPLFAASSPVSSTLVSLTYSPRSNVLALGHANGVIALLPLSALKDGAPAAFQVRRNEAPIYSLSFADAEAGSDLLVGTAAGLPCRLGVALEGSDIKVDTKEELAGWEMYPVEAWAVGTDSVWSAGGDGVIRRY